MHAQLFLNLLQVAFDIPEGAQLGIHPDKGVLILNKKQIKRKCTKDALGISVGLSELLEGCAEGDPGNQKNKTDKNKAGHASERQKASLCFVGKQNEIVQNALSQPPCVCRNLSHTSNRGARKPKNKTEKTCCRSSKTKKSNGKNRCCTCSNEKSLFFGTKIIKLYKTCFRNRRVSIGTFRTLYKGELGNNRIKRKKQVLDTSERQEGSAFSSIRKIQTQLRVTFQGGYRGSSVPKKTL